MPKINPLKIRNSTAEFLMFTADSRQDGIEVRFELGHNQHNVFKRTVDKLQIFKLNQQNIYFLNFTYAFTEFAVYN